MVIAIYSGIMEFKIFILTIIIVYVKFLAGIFVRFLEGKFDLIRFFYFGYPK